MSAREGICPEGWGVCLGGVCLGGCLPGGCLPRVGCLPGGVFPIACWDTDSPPVNRMTVGVKTLPCPKLRLRPIITILYNLDDVRVLLYIPNAEIQ